MKRRYALITAGAQGLGQAITRHLATQQYTLFVHYYTSQPAAEALQAELTDEVASLRLHVSDICYSPVA